jgi:hypothetical protein
MNNSKKNKNDFLGENSSTAAARLRRNILFHLAKKCGMNKCFRCGIEIVDPEEFSIDHKLPWLYVDIKLFWDMNNIAFSHKRCNKVDRPELIHRQKIKNPKGKNWCGKCKTFKSNKFFGKKTSSLDGMSNSCYDCRKAKNWDHK